MGSNQNPFHGNPLKALELFRKLVEVIKACKGLGIAHRDLHPANILVRPYDESIKVIDFGICLIEGGTRVTLTDEAVGTPGYMAPECEPGRPDPVTWIADIYSAGKVLWSAISNQNAPHRERPVFNENSMDQMFPNQPDTWHLHRIFEMTIRHEVGDRCSAPDGLLKAADDASYLIRGGYPEFELIGRRCPTCGYGELQDARAVLFGNRVVQGYTGYECSYCGCCVVMNLLKRKNVLDKRRELQ